MIVKKIPAHRDGRHVGIRRAKHARDLVDYMRSPEKESPLREYLVAYMAKQGLVDGPERLIHIGARNFVSEELDGQRAEMMAVAQAAVRTPNPIDHWLLSWQEGEIPTARQVDEAVEIFIDRLGMAKHQVIYAVHGDTHNRHCHIALNRYDPISRKVITIHKGYWKEASHQVVAEIVAHFGWKAEPNARYEWTDGAAEMSPAALLRVKEGLKPLRPGASRFEIRTGYRSAQRIAQDEAWSLIRQAGSWEEIHAGLAILGMTYDPVGTNGATISVGQESVKASDVNRYATITKLEDRLGAFRPRSEKLVISYRPGPDRFAGAFRADEYRQQCETWQKATPEQRIERHLRRPAPDLESFLHEKGEHHTAEGWRQGNRESFGLPVFEAEQMPGQGFVKRVGEFIGEKCAEGMRYARPGEGTAFVDTGKKITVLPGSDEALLAALRLAVQRFDGRVQVTGDPVMQRRVWTLAIEHDLHRSLVSEPPHGFSRSSGGEEIHQIAVVTPVTAAKSDTTADQTRHVATVASTEANPNEGRSRGTIAQAEALRRSSKPSDIGPKAGSDPHRNQEPAIAVSVTSVTKRRGSIIDQAKRLISSADKQRLHETSEKPTGSERLSGDQGSPAKPRIMSKGPRVFSPSPSPSSKDRGR